MTMSASNLTAAEIRTRREEELEKAKVIMEHISLTSHPLRENGRDFTRFMGYVDSLYHPWHCFDDYSVPASELNRHFSDIAEAAFRTGTHRVVCELVTSLMKTGSHVKQAVNSKMTKSVSNILRLLGILLNCSQSADVRYDLANHVALIASLLQALKAGFRAHVDKVMSEEQNLILDYSLKILNNCGLEEKNLPRLREAGTVDVLLPYLKSKDERIQLNSLATLAKLVNEKEAKTLLRNHLTIFTQLIQRLSSAIGRPSHRDKYGKSVEGLVETLRQLARNDANKRVLVNKGCLPLLTYILDCGYGCEVRESLEALFVLSVDENNKQKMVDEPDLVKRVWGKYSDISSSDKIRKSSYGILWSLMDQLKTGKSEWVDIATKIKEQKTKPDMELSQRSQQQTKRPSLFSASVSSNGHVMLSYHCEHLETIEKICQKLRDAGVPVWIDVEFLDGSSLDAMAKAVENCSIFIMSVSKGYKDSANCKLEAGYAQKLKKTIIPLMMEENYEPDGWLGIIMESKYFYDFSRQSFFEDTMSELLKAIKTTP